MNSFENIFTNFFRAQVANASTAKASKSIDLDSAEIFKNLKRFHDISAENLNNRIKEMTQTMNYHQKEGQALVERTNQYLKVLFNP